MTLITPATDATELLSVVYSSAAVVPFSEADLAALLMISRMRNEPQGITGMLLHRDDRFMQVLEGPASAVRATLARIAADPRHGEVWVLHEGSAAVRRFGSWAMGYRAVAPAEDVPAAWYGSPEAADPASGDPSSRSAELLAWFRDR